MGILQAPGQGCCWTSEMLSTSTRNWSCGNAQRSCGKWLSHCPLDSRTSLVAIFVTATHSILSLLLLLLCYQWLHPLLYIALLRLMSSLYSQFTHNLPLLQLLPIVLRFSFYSHQVLDFPFPFPVRILGREWVKVITTFRVWVECSTPGHLLGLLAFGLSDCVKRVVCTHHGLGCCLSEGHWLEPVSQPKRESGTARQNDLHHILLF